MTSPRHASQRMSAALLALLVQGLIIAALVMARGQRWSESSTSGELIFIQPIQLREIEQVPAPRHDQTSSATAARAAVATRRNRSAASNVPSVADSQAPDPTTAITVPPVDWRNALTNAARHAAELQAQHETEGEPLNSKPKVLKLPPPKSDSGLPDNVARIDLLDNGDMVIHYKANALMKDGMVCTHQQLSLAEHFDVWAQHRPAKCRPGGAGARGNAATEGIKSIVPGYLRAPLPVPPAPEADSGDER